jgi:hypothetical protein
MQTGRFGVVTINSLIGSDEALAYSFQVSDVFRAAGWVVKAGELSEHAWSQISKRKAKGVIILTNKPDYDVLAVEDVLRNLGNNPYKDILPGNITPIDGILVFIGEK